MVETSERVAIVKVRIPLVVVLGLAVVVNGLTGCTSRDGGTPTPATTSASTDPTSDAGHTTAPAVPHPLDASKATTTPCSALTAADVTGLNIVNGSGQAGSQLQAPSCSWAGDSGGTVSIAWETANTNGLSDLYAKSSTIAYWQPTTVSGYPAAYGDAISDGRRQGNCVINTAVSNQLYFVAQFDTPQNASQSCTLAEQAAADVIKNLGGS
jgi:hypothetical protein